MFIGKYEVIRAVGSGGMARAVLAKAPGGEEVVLKIPLQKDEETLLRFQDEARAGIRVNHPCLVQTLDYFTYDDRPVLVVSFVEGVPLNRLWRHGPMQPYAVAQVGRDICGALAAIHEATDDTGQPLQMVHRDVSPTNILVAADGCSKLIDLGIVRSAEALHKTATGDLRGTVQYIAPELMREELHSPGSDLWALGIVLFECLLGEHVFAGSVSQILMKIIEYQAENDSRLDQIDPKLRQIISMMLVQDHRKRIRNALHFVHLFEQFIDEQEKVIEKVQTIDILVHAVQSSEIDVSDDAANIVFLEDNQRLIPKDSEVLHEPAEAVSPVAQTRAVTSEPSVNHVAESAAAQSEIPKLVPLGHDLPAPAGRPLSPGPGSPLANPAGGVMPSVGPGTQGQAGPKPGSIPVPTSAPLELDDSSRRMRQYETQNEQPPSASPTVNHYPHIAEKRRGKRVYTEDDKWRLPTINELGWAAFVCVLIYLGYTYVDTREMSSGATNTSSAVSRGLADFFGAVAGQEFTSVGEEKANRPQAVETPSPEKPKKKEPQTIAGQLMQKAHSVAETVETKGAQLGKQLEQVNIIGDPDNTPACFQTNLGFVFSWDDGTGIRQTVDRIQDVPKKHRLRAKCIAEE